MMQFVQRILVLVAAASACAACEQLSLPSGRADLRLPVPGTEVVGKFDIGDKSVPLTSGTWTVIGTDVTSAAKRGYYAAIMLARIETGSVAEAAEIFTNIPLVGVAPGSEEAKLRDSGWLTNPNCTRTDLHHLDVAANVRLGAQNCWWVNHWRMNRTGASGADPHWVGARKYLADHAIVAPMDMIGVSYRLADKTDYLTVNYLFNPSTSGFAAWSDTNWEIKTWSTSDWTPDKVKLDARKKAYIDRLIAWGRQWHTRVADTFAHHSLTDATPYRAGPIVTSALGGTHLFNIESR